jgi:hypothetical protein
MHTVRTDARRRVPARGSADIAVMRMIRVRAATRSKPISTPILRRKVVAGGAGPPEHGGVGPGFRLGRTLARLLGKGVQQARAMPAHSVRVAIRAPTAVAIGSASITPSAALSDRSLEEALGHALGPPVFRLRRKPISKRPW